MEPRPPLRTHCNLQHLTGPRSFKLNPVSLYLNHLDSSQITNDAPVCTPQSLYHNRYDASVPDLILHHAGEASAITVNHASSRHKYNDNLYIHTYMLWCISRPHSLLENQNHSSSNFKTSPNFPTSRQYSSSQASSVSAQPSTHRHTTAAARGPCPSPSRQQCWLSYV